jgi:type I restriction enzyme R subunit
LKELKIVVELQILQNANILENESYVKRMIIKFVLEQLKAKNDIPLEADNAKPVNAIIVKEYMNEFYGRAAS